MHELSDDDALWIGQGVPLMDSRNAEIIALVRAGYRVAQAARPPLSAFGDILGHNYWMDATSLMKLWRRMQDAAQKEQTGGGVDGHAAIFGECARAERQTPIANPIAGIKPGPLDHQSAAGTNCAAECAVRAPESFARGPAADPIDDLCMQIRAFLADALERLAQERDALRECVRAADAMADAYYPDPFHHAPPLTVDAYNAARAKVNTTEGEK